MMDDEILKIVHSIFGEKVQIVDCEKNSSVHQEEILLINGIPVNLDEKDGAVIKNALLAGQVPPLELLNQLLYQAGILKQSIQLETSLSVKSSMVTTEHVSVARGDHILDGSTSETREDYLYNSSKKEFWIPVTKINTETMSHKPIFQLSEADTLTTEGSIKDINEIITGYNLTTSIGTTEHPLPLVSSSSSSDLKNGLSNDLSNSVGRCNKYYNCFENVKTTGNDDEHDKDREFYLLNPLQFSGASSLPPPTNKLAKVKNTFTTISDSTHNSYEDLIREYQKRTSTSSVAEKQSSLISFDSSVSQRTNVNNNVSTPAKQFTTNTDHLISSSYDFDHTSEADFFGAQTNSHLNLGKHCNKICKTKERSYADLQQLEQSQFFESTHTKNVKSPTSAEKLSMSTNSYLSKNPSSSKSEPEQQQSPLQHEVANNTSANKNISGAADFITTSTFITTSAENGLVFRDGNLISGPLEALIAHMVPSGRYYPDRSFIFSFLLSARLFIRPHELLARISETWDNQQQQSLIKKQSSDVVEENYSQPQSICSMRKSHLFQPEPAEEQNRQKSMKSSQNCIQLLSEWIDTFPYDFRDERLMQHVRVLARKCVYIDNSLGKIVSFTLQQLVQRLTVLQKYEEFLQTLTANETNENSNINEDLAIQTKTYLLTACDEGHTNSGYINVSSTSCSDIDDINISLLPESSNNVLASASSSMVAVPQKSLLSSYSTTSRTYHQHQSLNQHYNSHQIDSSSNSVYTLGSAVAGIGIGSCTSSSAVINGGELTGIFDFCPNAALLAHQLTHIELERLSHIGPEEFVQAFAKENHLESFSDMKKTRNLESYVQWFNRLSYFTATEIVKYQKKKQRIRIIEFWIETARECFNIGNFNSLMAIIAGLNLSPISRLKKTWSKIQSAKFSVLEHQMDPTSNFNSYRSTLKAAMWRSEGATNERERIIIPFFSLLVKDLYFLNEGCSNRLPNGHINFEKFRQLARQVMEFNTWKKVTCPFEKLPKVIMFLQLSTVLNENNLSMASFECEPPENAQEKGRYKTLKSETKHQHQQT